MAAVVHKGDIVVFVGDSVTEQGWYSATGGLVDQINATWTGQYLFGRTLQSGRSAVVSGSLATASFSPSSYGVGAINSGVSGNRIADISSNIASRITNYNPSVVVWEIGINDALGVPLGVGSPTNQATFQTTLLSAVDAVIAWRSTVQMVLLSNLLYQETWLTGPDRWQGATLGNGAFVTTNTPAAFAMNAQIKAVCDARPTNCTFADVSTQALAWEKLNNTPGPGAAAGFLTGDGLHPNATGKVLMGTWALPSFQVIQ